MRCVKAAARDCRAPQVCELQGCQLVAPMSGPAPAAAVALARQPIDLPPLTPPADYQPGPLMRAMMRLTDRGEAVVRRGPTPFAAGTDRDEVLLLTNPLPEPQPVPQTPPAPLPSPEAPPPAAAWRVLEVPGPAYVVYLGDKPLGLTMRIERVGA